MKTKTNARILAWLLSICLIAGISPAMPTNYAKAADVLTYDFTAAANNAVESGLYYFTTDWKDTTAGTHIDGVFDDVATYAVTEALDSAPFEIFYAYKDGSRYAGFYATLGLALNVDDNSGSTVRMKIKVADSGYYAISSSINSGVHKNETNTDTSFGISVYDDPADISATPAQPVVSTSFLPVFGKSTLTLNNGNPVYLDKDVEYIVDYSAKAGTTGANSGNFYVYNLTLTPKYPAITSTATIPTALAVNGSVTSTFGVSSVTGAEIEVKSNSDAVSVAKSGDSYTLTGTKEGSATVTVTASLTGGAVSKNYNIAVRNAPVAGEYVYYFNGMVHDAFAFYAENNTNTNANITKSAEYNAFDLNNGINTTAAKLSSPWHIFASWRSPAIYDTHNIFMTPEGIETRVNNGNVYTSVNAIVETDGWYTVDTDYSVSACSGTTDFKLYNGSKFVAQSQVAISEENSFDLKPVYLTTDATMKNAFYFVASNFSGTLTLHSMKLQKVAAPEVEAQSTVPLSYTEGDNAKTVAFKIGAMTADSVSVSSTNSAAVTAVASGANVTFTPVATGSADVTVTATYGATSVSKTYTINVAAKPLPANHDKFGVKGAYITKDNDGTYKVTFLSAIDSLNYKKVGFKVTVDGEAKDTAKVVNVYSSVDVSSDSGNETVNVASFGLDNGYVFFDSVNGIASGATVTFQPYAIDGNDTEILGKAFTATIE